jgi:hypothetical protein
MYPKWSWWVALVLMTAVYVSVCYWLFGIWGIVAAVVFQTLYLLWKVLGTRPPTKLS